MDTCTTCQQATALKPGDILLTNTSNGQRGSERIRYVMDPEETRKALAKYDAWVAAYGAGQPTILVFAPEGNIDGEHTIWHYASLYSKV